MRAELLEVEGHKLRFKVEAHDEDKKVGDGTHRFNRGRDLRARPLLAPLGPFGDVRFCAV